MRLDEQVKFGEDTISRFFFFLFLWWVLLRLYGKYHNLAVQIPGQLAKEERKFLSLKEIFIKIT